MPHKSTSLVVGVGVGVLLLLPSRALAQTTGPDLVIAMSHTGNFAVGEDGIYTIVVSNIGDMTSSGLIEVSDSFIPGPETNFGFVSSMGTGWSCSLISGIPNESVDCFSTSLIAPGGFAAPITLTVLPSLGGTVTNTACVNGGDCASDPTIIVAAVPTLPEWAMMALAVLLVLAGAVALRRRTT
jgi:uncharacterized repeat protein (TIGR01451 family)